MSKHTPGPWVVIYNRKGYPYQISAPHADDKKPGAVGTRITRWASIGLPASLEGQANAQLIAAAPDLLEALKDALSCLQEYAVGNQFAKARAAIAKAEGKA